MKYCLVFVFMFACSINAQINISRVSADLGIIKNYRYESEHDRLYSLYPEVKIGGTFFTKPIEWEILTSYWTDGINEGYQIRDGFIFSNSSIVFGGKLYFFPKECIEDFFWPLYLTSGISYHNINHKYVSGSDYTGNIGHDDTFGLTTFDFGFGIYFQIFDELRLRIDTVAFIPFNEDDRLYNKGSNGTLKIGLDYFINNE